MKSLIGPRTSASSSIRIERIGKIPDYDRAFDYLTKFYRRKACPEQGVGRPKLGHRASEEIDMTADSDDDVDESVTNGILSRDGDQGNEEIYGKEADPIGLAAGLPGKT